MHYIIGLKEEKNNMQKKHYKHNAGKKMMTSVKSGQEIPRPLYSHASFLGLISGQGYCVAPDQTARLKTPKAHFRITRLMYIS